MNRLFAITLLLLGLPAAANEAFCQNLTNNNSAQKMAEILLTEKSLDQFLDQITKTIPELPVPGGLNETNKQQISERIAEFRPQLKSLIEWTKLRTAFAQELSARFSQDELQALLAFYQSDVGSKWVEQQPLIAAGFLHTVAENAFSTFLETQAKTSLTVLESKLGKDELQAVAAAKQADPLPMEWLCQHWYEIDETDPMTKYYTSVKRSQDGWFEVQSVTIDVTEKTYSRYSNRSRWFAIGRLLIEIDNTDPIFNTVYLVGNVTKDRMTSQWVSEDLPLTEWEVINETTQPLQFPAVPDGYEVVDAE